MIAGCSLRRSLRLPACTTLVPLLPIPDLLSLAPRVRDNPVAASEHHYGFGGFVGNSNVVSEHVTARRGHGLGW